MESAKIEFTMATSQTAMPLLAPTDNDYTTQPHKVEDSANVSAMYDPIIHCLLCFIQYVNTTESWLTSTQQEVRKYAQAQLLQEDNDDNLH